MTLHPLISTLFPYTTLFRSGRHHDGRTEIWNAIEHAGRHAPETGVADTHGPERQPRHHANERAAPEQIKDVAADLSGRSEEHTSELQSPCNLVCRLLLEKKK